MSNLIELKTPLSDADVVALKTGDHVSISGIIYTARDAAHKRMVDALDRGEAIPFDPVGQIIYYAGPAPAKPGMPIGPVGPTTSYRMDPYAKRMMKEGIKGMIGKGNRSKEVKDAIKQYRSVYFAAIGGAAAVIAKSVKSAKVIAYEDLGPEAVRELIVEGFQAIVVNDVLGNDIYIEGIQKYAKG